MENETIFNPNDAFGDGSNYTLDYLIHKILSQLFAGGKITEQAVYAGGLQLVANKPGFIHYTFIAFDLQYTKEIDVESNRESGTIHSDIRIVSSKSL